MSTVYIKDGTPAADRSKAIMNKIIENGPITAAMEVYADFYSFSGKGVYKAGSNAQRRGYHGVVMLGWGTEKGVDYWIVQNSWGGQWGDKGRAKMLRGTDECKMETLQLQYATPEPVINQCKAACANGGEQRADCKCRCEGNWHGETCAQCKKVACENGGTFSDAECKCQCVEGTGGPTCKGVLAKLSNTCWKNKKSPLPTITWANFEHTVGTRCLVLKSREHATQAVKDSDKTPYANFCGWPHEWSMKCAPSAPPASLHCLWGFSVHNGMPPCPQAGGMSRSMRIQCLAQCAPLACNPTVRSDSMLTPCLRLCCLRCARRERTCMHAGTTASAQPAGLPSSTRKRSPSLGKACTKSFARRMPGRTSLARRWALCRFLAPPTWASCISMALRVRVSERSPSHLRSCP